MAFLAVLFLLIISSIPTSATIPDDFKLNVEPNCGSDGIENASIAVITDMVYITATAECSNGDYLFYHTKDVQFDLVASYPPSTADNCVFHKRADKLVYYIPVVVAIGNPENEVQQMQERYTVTCTFDPNADDYSFEHNVIEGLIAPTELQNLHGSDSGATVDLIVTDVLGSDITGTAIEMGRTIQIKVEATNAAGAICIFPVSCDAISGEKRYAVLRAGCGDGIVFRKDVGFTTSGLVSRSPYFRAFGVGRFTTLKFECNVTIRTTGCDGDTCQNERKRRWAESEDVKFVEASTATKSHQQASLILDTSEKNVTSLEDGQDGRSGSKINSHQIKPYNITMQDDSPEVAGSTGDEPPDVRTRIQANISSGDKGITQQGTQSYNLDIVQDSNVTDGSDGLPTKDTNISANNIGEVNSTNNQSDNRSQVHQEDVGEGVKTVQSDVFNTNTTDSSNPNETVMLDSPYKVEHQGNVSDLKDLPPVHSNFRIESGVVFVREFLGNVSREEVDNTKDDTKTVTKVCDGNKNTFSGIKPMYVVGIVIVGLFSFGSIVLAISLCRKRHQYA